MTSQLVDLGGGVAIACTVSGEGPPLLLLHGGEGDHRMFEPLRAQLQDTFTVIAHDQRDCGDTRAPGQPADLATLAQDAAALLDALGVASAHVFGSSFGGRVAQMLAHRHRDHVRSLVLGSTWALPERLDQLNAGGVAAIQQLRAGLPETAEALAAFFLPPAFLDAHPRHRELFRQARPQSPRGQRRAQALADHPALEPSALDVRTLVIAGEIDRVVPAPVTLALAARIPGARAVLLEGLGHATVLQDPARVARELRQFCLESAPRRPLPTSTKTTSG